MNVTIIQNSSFGASGLVGEFIGAKGWRCRRTLFPDDVVAADLGAIVDDIVVFFGSPCGVYETHIPWIARERMLMSRLIEAGVPVFGICFGGQLLATAAGGVVAPMGKRYRGWIANQTAVEPMWNGPWLRWHGDFITLPASIDIFASDQGTVQAFQYGSGVGVQFHPEASAELLRAWQQESDPNDGASAEAYRVAIQKAEDEAPAIRRRAFILFDHVFERITR